MKRFLILPTAIVALAVAAMIGLGVWQLQRAQWKEGVLAQFRANASAPPIAFPRLGPVPTEALFRASDVMCVRVAGWRIEAGQTREGRPTYRRIAECTTGAEGPGALVDMGGTSDPRATPLWRGGLVRGVITTEPDHSSLLDGLFGSAPVLRPMLVSATPAPGLDASAPPSIESVPNNHTAYAVQWFLFAGVALIIYILALRRRRTDG